MSLHSTLLAEELAKVKAERDRYLAALSILATRENWIGDPESHVGDSMLYGHFTPYELAVDALDKEHSR